MLKKRSDPPAAETAKGRSLKITLIYFVVGCAWILFSDKLAGVLFIERSSLVMFSIAKGLLYVLATAALIFGLTYTAMKKTMDAKDTIKQINIELEKSNEQYKLLYQKLAQEQSLLKSLVNSIPDLIFYKDSDSMYLGCNKAFEGYVGKTEEEIIGHSDTELFDRDAADAFRVMDILMLRKSAPRTNEEILKYPDGQNLCYETLKTPYYDPDGNIIGLIGVSRDITDRKKREEEIQYLNYHDSLTGLYNRTFFLEEKRRLDTERQLPLSVIIGDVNGLKLINDALGHDGGDQILIEIANIMKSHCRDFDIIARTGGDEFAILLPKTDSQTAQSVADRISGACKEYTETNDNPLLYIDIALGNATKANTDESLDKAIKAAEDFMYRRKLLDYKSMHNSIIASIRTTMFEKSYETEEHAERMVALSRKIGHALDLPEKQLDELELLSTLHDMGKISIDQNIIAKKGALTDEEWREIKKHPEVGYRIANASPELRHISEYILCHHERWDGNGYPQGLSRTDIPLMSRIIAIVDAYDAMTHDRSYRKAMTEEDAVAEIIRSGGTQFDPDITRIFAEKELWE